MRIQLLFILEKSMNTHLPPSLYITLQKAILLKKNLWIQTKGIWAVKFWIMTRSCHNILCNSLHNHAQTCSHRTCYCSWLLSLCHFHSIQAKGWRLKRFLISAYTVLCGSGLWSGVQKYLCYFSVPFCGRRAISILSWVTYACSLQTHFQKGSRRKYCFTFLYLSILVSHNTSQMFGLIPWCCLTFLIILTAKENKKYFSDLTWHCC